jgi:hypothetical protein
MRIKTNMRLVTFYAVVSILVLFSGSFYPSYNWDLIPYIASAKALECNDPIQIHSFAFSEIDKTTGTRIYSSSISQVDSPFRALMRTDYSAFSEMLAFYKVCVIYNLLVYLMFSVGINSVFATHFISAVSVFIATWILFLISRDRFSTLYQYAILPIVLALGAWEIAGLSTPDALAFMVVLAIVYFFLTENPVIYVFFPLLVAVRTDLLILIVFFSLSLLHLRPAKKLFTLISLVLSIGIVLLLNWHYNYPGWKAVFYFTFFDRLALTTPREFGLPLYIAALFRGFKSALKSPEFLSFSVIAGIAWFLSFRKFKGKPLPEVLKSKSTILLIISTFYVVIRMVMFPLPYARFLVGSYAIATISLFDLLSSKLRLPSHATSTSGSLTI